MSSSVAEWTYPYTAQEKQAIAHRRWAKERLYGGAAGGGKTEWLLAEVLAPILRYGVNGLLLRRTFGALNQPEGIVERLLTRIPRHIGVYNNSQHRWRFRNGALLQLGYLQNDGDVQQYMGAEFGVVGWDQVEQFTEWQYRRMLHPLRVSEGHPAREAGYRPFMVATANPGGVGHTWVKSRWIDPAPPGVVWQPSPSKDEPRPGSRLFVPATIDDNRFLGQDYLDQLDGLPEDERRALRMGDWDVYAGARFGRTWRRNVHVVDPEDYPVPLGASVARGIGIDYGGENPFAALWGARFGADGSIVVYRELYEAGLTPAEQAEAIRAAELEGERGPGRPVPAWLDPACWIRDPNQQKPPPGAIGGGQKGAPPAGSIADTYRRHGVPVQKANNDRRTGTALIASRLKPDRIDHRPRLYIYSSCLNLIRTLPGIPRDKKDPELYDTTGEDHAVDALRYLLMGLDGKAPPASDLEPPADPRLPRQPPAGSTVTAGMRQAGF